MIAGADDQGRPRSLAGATLRGKPISFSQVGGSSLAGPMWKKAMGTISAQLPPTDFAPPPEDEPDADDPRTPDPTPGHPGDPYPSGRPFY